MNAQAPHYASERVLVLPSAAPRAKYPERLCPQRGYLYHLYGKWVPTHLQGSPRQDSSVSWRNICIMDYM